MLSGLGHGAHGARNVVETVLGPWRDLVDDGLGQARLGEHLRPFAERHVGGDDQRAALVALADDLEDELGGARATRGSRVRQGRRARCGRSGRRPWRARGGSRLLGDSSQTTMR